MTTRLVKPRYNHRIVEIEIHMTKGRKHITYHFINGYSVSLTRGTGCYCNKSTLYEVANEGEIDFEAGILRDRRLSLMNSEPLIFESMPKAEANALVRRVSRWSKTGSEQMNYESLFGTEVTAKIIGRPFHRELPKIGVAEPRFGTVDDITTDEQLWDYLVAHGVDEEAPYPMDPVNWDCLREHVMGNACRPMVNADDGMLISHNLLMISFGMYSQEWGLMEEYYRNYEYGG